MHIVKVETNINSPDGRVHTTELGQRTLLVGPNGSGKTVISAAVRLALTGTTDDVANRDGVRDAQLLRRLLPPSAPANEDGSRSLVAHVTFDDGSEAGWGLVVEPSGAVKRPLHEPAPLVDPERVLALRSIWTILRGDEKAARRALLTWIGQGVQEEDALALIPAHLHGKFRDISEKQQGSVVDRVVAVAEYAARRAREVEADAAAQDRLIDQLKGALSVKPAASDIEEARAAVNQWRALLDLTRGWEEPPPTEVYLEKRKALLAAEEAVEQWTAEVANQDGATLIQQHARVSDALLRTAQSGVCFACAAPSSSQHLEAWASWHRMEALRMAREAESAGGQGAEAALAAWTTERNRLQKEVALLEAQQVAAEGRVPPPLPMPDCQAGLKNAEAYLSSLERADGAWKTVTAARDAAAELRSSKPVYVELATACNKAVADLLQRLSSDFVARVQNYLPDRYQFGMNLGDTFEVGFIRDGVIHTLLSGTEYDAMQVALAMAVADMGGGATIKKGRGRPKKGSDSTAPPYALIIPQDRDRDSTTLGELMRAWSKFGGQVIVEATEPPRGRSPQGWTVVDVGEWRRGLAAPQEAPGAPTAKSTGPEIVTGSGGVVYSETEVGQMVVKQEDVGDVTPTPPASTPNLNHISRLRELGYKEPEVALLLSNPQAAEAVALGNFPRTKVLVSKQRIVIFDAQGRPDRAFSPGEVRE